MTKALIRLSVCAGWSAPLLFMNTEGRFLEAKLLLLSSIPPYLIKRFYSLGTVRTMYSRVLQYHLLISNQNTYSFLFSFSVILHSLEMQLCLKYCDLVYTILKQFSGYTVFSVF